MSTPPSVQDLQTASDHLHYEIWMTFWATDELAKGPANPFRNALLECFLTHVRSLYGFFGYHRGKVLATDVIAEHFLPTWSPPGLVAAGQPTGPGLISASAIADQVTRMNQMLAHLTYGRASLVATSTGWHFGDILPHLIDAVKLFDKDLSQSHKGTRWSNGFTYPTPPPQAIPTGFQVP